MIQIDAEKHTPSKIIGILIVLVIIAALAGGAKLFIDYKSSAAEEEKVLVRSSLITAYGQGDFDAAIDIGQDLVVKYPNDANGYVLLANAYVQKGSIEFNEDANADIAIELLNKALVIDSNNSEAYRMLGYAYEIKQDYVKSLSYYDMAFSIDPYNDDILTSRGHMYELSGDYGNAEKDYLAAISINDLNSLALINLASIYIATGRSGEYDVEFMLNQAFQNAEDSRVAAESYNMLGTLYAQRGEHEKARSAFQESLQYDSRLTASWMGRAFADVELMSGTEDETEFGSLLTSVSEAIDSALFLNPNQSTAYMLQGILAGTFGADPAAEIALYNQAISVIENDITLDKIRKAEMRTRIQSLIQEVDINDPELKEIKAEIILDTNEQ